MRLCTFLALSSFAGLVASSRYTPTLLTATVGMALAVVLAAALVPVVRNTLEEVVR